MQKGIILIILGVLIIGGIWYASTRGNEAVIEEEDLTEIEDQLNEEGVDEEEVAEEGEQADSEVKEFVVSGENMRFSMEEIHVNEGDTVRIVFSSNDAGMMHDWVLDEFDAQTRELGNGEEETIEFVASAAGEYEYYCSVGNHRQMGMVGTLIVE